MTSDANNLPEARLRETRRADLDEAVRLGLRSSDEADAAPEGAVSARLERLAAAEAERAPAGFEARLVEASVLAARTGLGGTGPLRLDDGAGHGGGWGAGWGAGAFRWGWAVAAGVALLGSGLAIVMVNNGRPASPAGALIADRGPDRMAGSEVLVAEAEAEAEQLLAFADLLAGQTGGRGSSRAEAVGRRAERLETWSDPFADLELVEIFLDGGGEGAV